MKRAWLIVAAVLLSAPPAFAVYQCGDTVDDCICGAPNPYPCCDNGGNCTWYAWESACCQWGVAPPGWGNANTWAQYARANASYAVHATAVTSSVACRDAGQYGHVGYVNRVVSSSNIEVWEQNCWGNYGVRVFNYTPTFFTGGFITTAGPPRACNTGDTQSRSCGNCGTQSRGCTAAGQWGAFGTCSSQGVCAAGATDSVACGDCGVAARTCTSSCQWGGAAACTNDPSVNVSGSCDTGLVGACKTGARVCQSGQSTCRQTTQPSAEQCDGLDNDCDGTVDEDSCIEAELLPVRPGIFGVAAQVADAGAGADPVTGLQLESVTGCGAVGNSGLVPLLGVLGLCLRRRRR